ncbi:MAG: ImmA/IrrE family metallo-endopeptidase [Spirochaetaceae bacterium]|nr:MAG: ImmA/IrrE family metallo-endopeptidase [Spirochaetaceae bacterium]
MKYRDISFKEYRDKADKLLQLHGFVDAKIPIDPERLIRKMGDIDIIPYKNLYIDYRVKGMVAYIVKRQRFQIYIDEYHYDNQTKSSLFTLAEELGHLILHLDNREALPSHQDKWADILKLNHENHKNMENQARTFGSNIILPHKIFDPFAMDWVKKNEAIIRKHANYTPEGLAQTIGFHLEDVLEVSQYILQISLLRYPDPLVF